MEAWENLIGKGGTRVAVTLGLTDFYHSVWFTSLLAILVLNMLACMTNRIPGMLSALSGKAALGREAVLELPDSDENSRRVASALGSLGFRGGREGTHRVFSRGAVGYLFTLLTHGSILIIMASSLAGSAAGFIATQRVYVGDSTKTAYNWKEGADRPLPFEVRVEDLVVLPNPVGVRLGILEVASGSKGKLITTHEGGSFKVPGLEGRFTLDSFNVEEKKFSASWITGDGTKVPIGSGEEIADSGLSLLPVAFATWPEQGLPHRLRQGQVRAALRGFPVRKGPRPGRCVGRERSFPGLRCGGGLTPSQLRGHGAGRGPSQGPHLLEGEQGRDHRSASGSTDKGEPGPGWG
jgi:hypothetical protein